MAINKTVIMREVKSGTLALFAFLVDSSFLCSLLSFLLVFVRPLFRWPRSVCFERFVCHQHIVLVVRDFSFRQKSIVLYRLFLLLLQLLYVLDSSWS